MIVHVFCYIPIYVTYKWPGDVCIEVDVLISILHGVLAVHENFFLYYCVFLRITQHNKWKNYHNRATYLRYRASRSLQLHFPDWKTHLMIPVWFFLWASTSNTLTTLGSMSQISANENHQLQVKQKKIICVFNTL